MPGAQHYRDEILTLLEACEWYSEVFTDDNGNEIPDMLEYIADWLEKTVKETEDSEPDTMTYVAVLKKFSYLYQKYDVQYATQMSSRIRNLHKAGSSIRQRCGEIHGFDGTVPGCGNLPIVRREIVYCNVPRE